MKACEAEMSCSNSNQGLMTGALSLIAFTNYAASVFTAVRVILSSPCLVKSPAQAPSTVNPLHSCDTEIRLLSSSSQLQGF